MATEELDEASIKLLKTVRESKRPLTLDEIVKEMNAERKQVVKLMVPLVKKGFIKVFLREEKGEMKAVYVVL